MASHAWAFEPEQSVEGPSRFIGFEAGVSLLTAIVERSSRAFSLEHQVRIGRTWDRWMLLGFVEHVAWDGPSGGSRLHALNFGVGVERIHRSRFLRTTLLVGPSILMQGTEIDPPQFGLFFDFRPIGVRWRLNPSWALLIDPVHLAIVMPEVTGIPLVDIQFRTTIGVETYF